MSSYDRPKPEAPAAKAPRRKILIASAAVAGAGALGAGGFALWRRRPVEAPKVKVDREVDTGFYRRLGRTELKVSAVGIGAGNLGRPGIVARAVDSGINYIDTSICYGDSEEVIARELQARKDLRDKLVIATKWDAAMKSPKSVILESLDRSLKRLGVETIDIMQLHWLGGGHVSGDDGFNRLDNEELYAAMEEAKKSGKVRFFGATSHDKNRSAILMHAIDKGVFDMILVKMNVLDFEDAGVDKLLDKAREKDVGVVAMKTQAQGGRLPAGFESEKWNLFQANVRWALSKGIACVVHSDIGTSEEGQDQAVEAAKEELSSIDVEHLERYAEALSPLYCRGCDDACTAACPEGIAIGQVLHAHLYEEDYGWHDRAIELYERLPPAQRWSETCLECSACTSACPFGVDARGRVVEARSRLGLRGPLTGMT